MARKTIYCAQPFWRRASRWAAGEVRQFLNEERAMAGAKIMLSGADGVAVFSLEGHPDEDLWDDPKMIAILGEAPDHAAPELDGDQRRLRRHSHGI